MKDAGHYQLALFVARLDGIKGHDKKEIAGMTRTYSDCE